MPLWTANHLHPEKHASQVLDPDHSYYLIILSSDSVPTSTSLPLKHGRVEYNRISVLELLAPTLRIHDRFAVVNVVDNVVDNIES